MKPLKLIRTLNRLFLKTNAHQVGGELIQENDLVFFSAEDIEKSDEIKPIPAFVIILISENDKVGDIQEKISEYFKAGVGGVPLKVVWLVFPEEKSVHVYTSRRDVKICIENDICSAAPVLPDFEIGVDVLLG
nr:Uma2 family endonuclease [uncultured Emticicia sp.]